jgi:uncharacterized Zn finger protein
VAQRRRRAAKQVASLKKKGKVVTPVAIEGRTIARTFWGKAWCDNLESYSDFENRLPRGRTYVRNGSVVHLEVESGRVASLVAGSSLYSVEVSVKPVAKKLWKSLARDCAGKIDSVVELLEGKLSRGVMDLLARRGPGLFPEPRDISFECSCPDWADMCKHVAATLYGVGARLDEDPEVLFALRNVDHSELIATAGTRGGLANLSAAAEGKVLETADLSEVFGIELEESVSPPEGAQEPRGRRRRVRAPAAKSGRNKAPGSTGASSRPRRVAKRKDDANENRKQGRSREAPKRPRRSAGKRAKTTRSGVQITAQALIDRGVPRSTFQNWLATGVLRRTSRRGVYKTTAKTEARIARVLERSGAS